MSTISQILLKENSKVPPSPCTVPFRRLQAKSRTLLGLHDTCGVQFLHGIPGLVSGILSVAMCAVATPEGYGEME